MLQEGDDFIGAFDKKSKPIIYENWFSITSGAELSIKLLEQHNPLCIALLYFLGCLPGGATLHQLQGMWDPEVRQYLEFLKHSEFLEDIKSD